MLLSGPPALLAAAQPCRWRWRNRSPSPPNPSSSSAPSCLLPSSLSRRPRFPPRRRVSSPPPPPPTLSNTTSSSTARPSPRSPGHAPAPAPEPDASERPDVELGFDDWADRKLSPGADPGMDKSKRKYYSKRMKRMYGSDSEDKRRRSEAEGGFVELRPETVEFHRLHKREEELYFYDAFAYPWEKDKHYKMVYQLEKKYFPEHCLDKAFLELGESGGVNEGKEKMEDKKLVFFEEEEKKDGDDLTREEGKKDVMEKKVEEFFKCLKKVPSEKNAVTEGEPYVLTRSTELPPRWDGPHGTVVLVNKPKGGKRRRVKIAGKADPHQLWSCGLWPVAGGIVGYSSCVNLHWTELVSFDWERRVYHVWHKPPLAHLEAKKKLYKFTKRVSIYFLFPEQVYQTQDIHMNCSPGQCLHSLSLLRRVQTVSRKDTIPSTELKTVNGSVDLEDIETF
ncbi:hypothetical protein ACJRO7_005181 [Eucalyptus globulus]|uniref:Uncharacterized protein n=1 Tax=Eucalyptus globulus TaxID=34317 RepID=A0ABD3J4V8_EUCGL